MSLDGIFLNSIKCNLNNKLIGGRIDKVYQPDKNEIIITIRNGKENFKLLLTSTSSCPRVHFTNLSYKNPSEPPMFCMLLRKHIIGSRIIDIKQINFDRVIEITFECKDELKTTVNKSIIIEIMGKHSNIIFINSDTRIIIDSIKRVAENMSSIRQIYPGIKYVSPPFDKTNPLEVSKDIFFDLIDKSNDGMYIYDFIYKTFNGLSPFISKEICFLSSLNENTYVGELDNLEKEKFYNSFKTIMDKVKNEDFIYNIFMDDNSNMTGFYCFYLENLKDCKRKEYDNPGELLDNYYYEIDNKNKINQKISGLIKSISTKIDRDKKKVEKQRTELLSAENRDKYKIYGELILANLHVDPIDNKLTVINYYDEKQDKITIPLDPRLNLSQNSQKFFKKYNKLKKAEEELQKLIKKSLNEISYLENILFSIEECETTQDLDDIYLELIEEGFMKRKSKLKKSKEYKPEILTYISSNNHEILVGKNNLQNDLITFKLAKKDDFWFHSKNVPGSHVVIKTNGDDLTDNEYVEASRIAAYYSKGKNSSLVEIDYTKKINLKKPPNAKPGFVIYDTNYSMMAPPNLDGIRKK